MSTIETIDRQKVGYNVQEIGNKLSDLSGQAKTDMDAAESRLTVLEAASGALDWKNSVVLATTGALAANTRASNTLTADANGALGTIDGVDTATLSLPFRLLVKNEATQANNGIYNVTALGDGSSPWVMTRGSDADSSAEVTPDMMVPVERGSANGDKVFQLDIDGPVTLNTTALVFADWRGLAITAPADVTKAAAAVGTSLTVARSDHKHDVSTAVAGATAIGDAAAEGSASSIARSDHRHSVAAGTPVAVGVANVEGAAVSFSRSDHVHNNGNQRFQLTLDGVTGAATKSAGVTVTANTRAFVTLVTPGAGASGTRYAVSYGVGGPGVGSITVTAKDSGAGNNTVTTDNSVLDIVCVEAASV